jgi:hypothetical protein
VRLAGGSLGVLLVLVGAVTTWNLVADPDARLGGRILEPLFLLGPAFLVGGTVLVGLATRESSLEAPPRNPPALIIGLVLLGAAAAPRLTALVTGHELASFLSAVATVALGLPGVLLVAVGAVLRITRGASRGAGPREPA